MKCEDSSVFELLRADSTPAQLRHSLSHVENCRSCRARLPIAAALEAGPMPSLNRTWLWLPAAAAAVFVSLLLLPAEGPLRPAELATEAPYPIVRLITRSTDAEPAGAALTAYEKGDYARALRLLERRIPDSDTLFLAGLCHYLEGSLETARQSFERSLEGSSRWRRPAVWYLANIALRQSRVEAARTYLKRLSTAPGDYRDEAARLLDTLGGVR